MRQLLACLVLCLGSSLFPKVASGDLPDILKQVDIDSILPQNAVKTLLKTVGILTKHNAFQGAPPPGFDIGVEASLVHAPNELGAAFSSFNGSAASELGSLAAVPMGKFHIDKGLGPNSALGLSGLYYSLSYMIGINYKILLYEPEEGLAWAFRVSYSITKLDFSKFNLSVPVSISDSNFGSAKAVINTKTFSPQIVASKRLEFAEPYFGFGLDWTTGQIDFPITIDIIDEAHTLSTNSYSAFNGEAFLGVNFRTPLGVRIGMEGAYSTLGMHRLGVIIGLSSF